MSNSVRNHAIARAESNTYFFTSPKPQHLFSGANSSFLYGTRKVQLYKPAFFFGMNSYENLIRQIFCPAYEFSSGILCFFLVWGRVRVKVTMIVFPRLGCSLLHKIGFACKQRKIRFFQCSSLAKNFTIHRQGLS